MRRSRFLLWLAALAVVAGRSSGTLAATALAVRSAVEAYGEHALPTAPRLRLASAALPSPERARSGDAAMHALPAPFVEQGPRGVPVCAAPIPAPAFTRGAAGALPYFPTGPPLLV
jgi:hypothetical protein